MKYKEIVFWILILLIVGLCIYLLYYIKTESYQCMSNPYVYSIKLLEKANEGTVMCSCISPKGSMLLTRDGFKSVENNYLMPRPE